jgi:N-acetylmuramoyl-L-alanine amidase
MRGAQFSGVSLSRCRNSGILLAVLGVSIPTFLLACALVLSAYARPPQAPQGAAPSQTTPQSPPQAPQQQSTPQANAPADQQPPARTPPPTPPRNELSVVVLDPAHGGADTGARGSSGISESDVVLSYARLVRISLEAQGFRVILTRQSNEDPSFDDRSKLANAQRGVVFVSLHVSSTGPPQTVRVYSMPQDTTASAPRAGLVVWDHAQNGFQDLSRRLAELVQVQMAQRFRGSPELPATAPVRQLRTVAAPAVAIEVSSVSLTDRTPLDQMGPPLADAVARSISAFRLVYAAGMK